MPKDYYITLGVERGASANSIKKAYRRVVKQLHPDVTHSSTTAPQFLTAQKAYETLMDEKKRRQYDDTLTRRPTADPFVSRKRAGTRSGAASLQCRSEMEAFFGGIPPDPFGRVSAGGGRDLYCEVVLTPEEAFRGGLFPLRIPVYEACAACGGVGHQHVFFCPTCRGAGHILAERSVSLCIPPRTRTGTRATISMEDVGLRGVALTIQIFVDSGAID